MANSGQHWIGLTEEPVNPTGFHKLSAMNDGTFVIFIKSCSEGKYKKEKKNQNVNLF